MYVVRLMPEERYYHEVIFDAQFSQSNLEWIKNTNSKIFQFFSLPHAFKTDASPYAGIPGSVFFRRRLA